MELFARLAKVHEEERVIHARALCEEVDRSGEIIDYDEAVTAFKKWSAEMQASSGGKSMGNVRVMHQPRVAGRIIDVSYNDQERAIDVVIKVDDEQIWQMCKTGAYTGLSIGGAYGRKWNDPENPKVTRYAPKLSEVSIVDRPCVASATFQLLKADGSSSEKHFADAPSIDAELIEELRQRVAAHNEAHSNPRQKTKLGDLKKAWERGAGIPGGGVVERHTRGMRKVDELLNKLSKTELPPKPRTFSELLKSERGNNVGAYAGAAVTGGIYGFVGRKVGGVAFSPITASLMAGSRRARKLINRTNDAYIGLKTGVKRAMRSNSPGLIPSAIRHSVRTGKQLDAKASGVARMKRSVRGVMRVPGVAVGTTLGAYAFNRDLKRRKAKKMDGGELQKRSTLGAIGRAARSAAYGIKPRGRFGGVEAAGLAATTTAGAAAGAATASRGNPYRDENGKFTSKDKAVLVVGAGVTAGAAIGLAGGAALTRFGMRRIAQKAQNTFKNMEAEASRVTGDLAGFEADRPLRAVGRVKELLKEKIGELENQRLILEGMTPGKFAAREAAGLNSGTVVRNTSRRVADKAKEIDDAYENLSREYVREKDALASLKAKSSPGAKDLEMIEQLEASLPRREAQVTAAMRERSDLTDRMNTFRAAARKRIDRNEAKMKAVMSEANSPGGNQRLVDLYNRSADPKTKGLAADFRSSGVRSMMDNEISSLAFAETSGSASRTAAARKATNRAAAARRVLDRTKQVESELLSTRMAAAAARATSPMRGAFRGFAEEASVAAKVMARSFASDKPSAIGGILSSAKKKIFSAAKSAVVTKRPDGSLKPRWKTVGPTVAAAVAGAGYMNAIPKLPHDLRFDTQRNEKGDVTIAAHYKDPKDPSRRLVLTDVTFPANDVADLKIGVPGTVWRGGNQGGGGGGGGGAPLRVDGNSVASITSFMEKTKSRNDVYDRQGESEFGVVFRKEVNDKDISGLGAQAGNALKGALLQDFYNRRSTDADGKKIASDADIFDIISRANGGIEFDLSGGRKANGSLLSVRDTGEVLARVLPGGNRLIEAAKKSGSERDSELLSAAQEVFRRAPKPTTKRERRALIGSAYVFRRNGWITEQQFKDFREQIASPETDSGGVPF